MCKNITSVLHLWHNNVDNITASVNISKVLPIPSYFPCTKFIFTTTVTVLSIFSRWKNKEQNSFGFLEQRFSTSALLALWKLWSQIFLCWGRCHIHFRIFSIPGDHSLNANSSSPTPILHPADTTKTRLQTLPSVFPDGGRERGPRHCQDARHYIKEFVHILLLPTTPPTKNKTTSLSGFHRQS